MKSAIITLLFVLALVTTSAAQTQEQLIAGAKKEASRRLRFGDRAATANVFCHVQQKVPIYQNGFFRTGKQKLVSKILFEEQAKQHIAISFTPA